MGILAVFLPHELILLPGLIWLCTCSSPKKQVKNCVCLWRERVRFFARQVRVHSFILLTRCFIEQQADR